MQLQRHIAASWVLPSVSMKRERLGASKADVITAGIGTEPSTVLARTVATPAVIGYRLHAAQQSLKMGDSLEAAAVLLPPSPPGGGTFKGCFRGLAASIRSC